MIDTIDYNSSTLYRYATVNVDALMGQLCDAEATVRACRAFVEAFVRSMPTGKQNTFANRTLPGTVCVALREDQPINVVGAFESPVYPSEGASISSQATVRLANEMDKIEGTYAQPAQGKWYLSTVVEDDLPQLGEKLDFIELLEKVSSRVNEHLERGGER